MRSFILCLTLLLVACGHKQNFYAEREDDTPHGYFDIKLSDNKYMVGYESYKSISLEAVESMMRFRAAEIAKSKEFRYYLLMDLISEINEENVHIPESTRTIQLPSYSPTVGGNLGEKSVVTIPAHVIKHQIKRSSATVLFSDIKESEEYESVEAILMRGVQEFY